MASAAARGYGRLQRTTEGIARGLIRAGRCAGRALMIYSDGLDMFTSTVFLPLGPCTGIPLSLR